MGCRSRLREGGGWKGVGAAVCWQLGRVQGGVRAVLLTLLLLLHTHPAYTDSTSVGLTSP